MSAVTVEPTEAEFQQQVIDLAHLLGWKHLHVRRTIGRKNQWEQAAERLSQHAFDFGGAA